MNYGIIFFFIALVFCIGFVAQWKWKLFTKCIHPWLNEKSTLLGAYRSIVAFIGFPFLIIGGIFTYTQIMKQIEQPDVGLQFTGKTNTVIYVKNLSNVVAWVSSRENGAVSV